MGFARENLLRLPTLLKAGQIVLLIIAISIAQGGSSYPGFGGAVTANVTDTSVAAQEIHCMEDKHVYFFGAGICTCYLINCCVLVISYLLGDTKTQFSRYEMGMSIIGSIFFLAMAMDLFVNSDSGTDEENYMPKLITEGCCCVGVAVLQIFDAIFIHLRIKKGDFD